jgi:hypothetical protein
MTFVMAANADVKLVITLKTLNRVTVLNTVNNYVSTEKSINALNYSLMVQNIVHNINAHFYTV